MAREMGRGWDVNAIAVEVTAELLAADLARLYRCGYKEFVSRSTSGVMR